MPAPPAKDRRAPAPIPAEVRIRLATRDDAHALARLAALDSAPPLGDAAVLAERDGAPIAALALRDGRTVADPFVHTGDVIALLALRADQIAAADASVRPPRRLRLRFWATSRVQA